MIFRTFLILLCLFHAIPAFCGETDRLSKENRLLESELRLSKGRDLYLVVKLKEKTVEIKAGGMTLRTIPVMGIRYWGSELPDHPMVLTGKSTFFKPRRERINPAKNSGSDTFEIDALEVDDMPSRYSLMLDRKVFISVTPGGTLLAKTFNSFSFFAHLVARPFKSFWYAVRGQPYTALDLILEKKDAQALYWSLGEGMRGIVYPP